MRLFFALDINNQDKQRIALWREQHLSVEFKPVAVENFHITLAFLGHISASQQLQLLKLAEHNSTQATNATSITLQLDYCDLFIKPQVLYLGINNIPSMIENLANSLSKKALSLGIYQEQRPYKAHVSLFRKAKYKPALIKPINLLIKVNSFSLYQSISAEESAVSGGVQYCAIHTWPLVTAD